MAEISQSREVSSQGVHDHAWIHRPSFFVTSFLFVATVAMISGCGGSSPSIPTVTLNLSSDLESILETSDSSVVITVTTDEPVTSTTQVNLQLSGTATRNVDYELSSDTVEIPVNSSSGSVELTPIRDWDLDPGEVVTISFGQLTSSQVAGESSSTSVTLLDGPIPADYKQDISADLRVYANIDVLETLVVFRLTVYNLGAEDASETNLSFVLRTDLSNGSTNVFSRTMSVPAISNNQTYSRTVAVLLSRLEASTSYYGFAALNQTPEESSQRSRFGHDYIGFSLDSERRVVTQCNSTEHTTTQGTPDPLFSEQWHLSNTGQTAFAESGGSVGADLGMENTLTRGPFGEGVRVAIVDTGLEQCHPDLQDNVEANASFNFASGDYGVDQWFGAVSNDAFNPYSLGDHGTSIAGIVSSVVNNGIGGRGIAPSSLLRGYNFLSYQSAGQAVALGSSRSDPNSSEVDVFNMSYGSTGYQGNVSSTLRDVFLHGTSSLRDGLGSVYVKSAGNGFGSCVSIEHELHSEIGCRASSSDPTNNLPYLVVVAGFNANDTRASYSSTGSNVWVTAPAGQFGSSQPAVVTTDQQGVERGYVVLSPRGLAIDRIANKDGNYMSTFNGTSAAAPMVTGSVAALLSANPDLTWRDIKHILASTARPIDNDVPTIRIAFGGGLPHIFRHGWTLNGAGYWFHNWYGFGAVDLDAAIEMADTHQANSLGNFEESNWISQDVSVAIPDFNSSGATLAIEVTEFPQDASIEAVQVEVKGEHAFLPDLSISITSPSGTQSEIIPAFNDTLAGYEQLDWQLLSNAFYGENPNGVWTLKVVDAGLGDTGTVTEWSLRFYYGSH